MSPLRLAWSNLRHQLLRSLLALTGVAAVVLLVFMQLGFLDSVRRTATLLFDQLDFDLILVSSEYDNLQMPGSFPRARLAQARSADGVQSVRPLTASLGLWRSPRPVRNGRHDAQPEWNIMVLAVDPASLAEVFRDPVGGLVRSSDELAAYARLLGRGNTVLIDRTSRKEYGDAETWRPGTRNVLNGRSVVIVGDIKIGSGFGYNGLLLLSEETLATVTGWPAERVTFGLITLAPGHDPRRARDELARHLPEGAGVKVLTRDDLSEYEIDFWMNRTAIGQFFLIGVGVALVVGGMFVYQMMAADINKNLPEYATIRALGYKGKYLSRVVIAQGVLLALLGYVPGLICSLVGYEMARDGAHIPIGMTTTRLVSVLGMTLLMCLLSASVAVRIVQRANPADLF
jgi:putative ABC transport system permease protein